MYVYHAAIDRLEGHMGGQDEVATPAEGERVAGGRYRTTIYLGEHELTALDELRIHFRRHEKRQVDRSQLIRDAIRRYHQALLEG